MRRKFFRLWITFVLTGPRGTPSLSYESLIERPSPSETRTCTSHEKMTRRRDRRRVTETDEGIRNEVSLLCLPGVDITRTVINTRNTMITRCDVQGVPFRTNVSSDAGGIFLGAVAFGWIGRALVTCRMCRALGLLERDKKKVSAGKSYRRYYSEEAFYYILTSPFAYCKDLRLLGFSFSPCQRLAIRTEKRRQRAARFERNWVFHQPR